MLVEILFYIFGTILVAAALGVIVSRNPVYSALSLVLCFVTSAAIWLLIEAEFLAVVLVLVYVGAVMVLFLFVVMMLDINLEELRHGFTRYAWLGWLTALAVIVEIVGCGLGARAWHRCHEVTDADRSRLQQYPRARPGAVHEVRISVRARGRAAAGRHRRGDLPDHAQASRTQGPGHLASRSLYRPTTACVS